MTVALRDADVRTSGAKAATLGTLLRSGFAVPDGFVLPFGTTAADLPAALARGLPPLGDAWLAVRSSASGEDSANGSAAGQYESVLGVRGEADVTRAVRVCWESLGSARAVAYRAGEPGVPRMAVLVQRLVDADASGVLFTPTDPVGVTRIEAAWGLGPGVVGGTVTPDAYCVAGAGVSVVIGEKGTRFDRVDGRLRVGEVAPEDRRRRVLDDSAANRLAETGRRLSERLGGPLDVEWALEGEELWIVQARPVTAAPPAATSARAAEAAVAGTRTLVGTPASAGTATGVARVVTGPGDFGDVRRGDLLVCAHTDPAWTPLLGLVGGVITETGGALSHAAIVARELGIPAVVGAAGAMRIRSGARWTIDGSAGTATLLDT